MLKIEDVVSAARVAVETALPVGRMRDDVASHVERAVRDSLTGVQTVALEVNGCHVWLVREHDDEYGEDYVQLCGQPAAGEDEGSVNLEGEAPGMYYPRLEAEEATAS